MNAQSSADSRRARGETTKSAIMRAAERLIAKRGVENVSIKGIVAAANQKNESALQYHFKNLAGLLEAIHKQRAAQIEQMRLELLNSILKRTTEPDLRALCSLMVEPAFRLASAHPDFRHYIKAFGHQLALAESLPLRVTKEAQTAQVLGARIKKAVPHLDATDFRARMDAATRMGSASMYHQARQTGAFRGPSAELFLNALIDALYGIFSAPVSKQTRALKRSQTKIA